MTPETFGNAVEALFSGTVDLGYFFIRLRRDCPTLGSDSHLHVRTVWPLRSA
jgi:hypothetical protein